MQREREAAGKEFSEADAFAVARVRAYLQTWSTCGQLVSWRQPTLLTVLRKSILGYTGSRPVTGDLQKRIGRLTRHGRILPLVRWIGGGDSCSGTLDLLWRHCTRSKKQGAWEAEQWCVVRKEEEEQRK